MKNKEFAGRMVQICLLFAAGIMAGSLLFNVLWRSHGVCRQMLWLENLDLTLQFLGDLKTMQSLLLIGVCAIFAVLFLAGFARIGRPFAQGMVFCSGIRLGWMLSLLLVGRGSGKMFRFFLENLFLFLLALPAYLTLNALTCNMSTEWKISLKQRKIATRNYVFFMALGFAVYVSGILLQCYVNPVILKILQKF